jgi:hypothetical protein
MGDYYHVVGLRADAGAESGMTADGWDFASRQRALEFALELRDQGEHPGGVRVYKQGQKGAVWMHQTTETQAWIDSFKAAKAASDG